MKLRLMHLSFVIALVVSLFMPATSYAESTNRNEVRAGLSNGGWSVVYGDLINEADYVLFIAAVAAAVACECPTPIAEYFDNQLQAQITKIEATAPDIARDALEDLIIQTFNSDGEILRHANLEISGGLATYNRWETVIYDEPRTYKCKQDLPFGGWTWSICTTVERVEKTVPYPNNFQPYFRFRIVSSGTTQGSPTETTSASGKPYAVVCLKNSTSWNINYQFRWGEREWQSRMVEANSQRWHSWTYDVGSTSSPNFEIRFDADFTDGTNYMTYDLKRYQASQESCDAGRAYEFNQFGTNGVDLYSVE